MPTEYPSQVRLATLADVDKLEALMRLAHTEQPIAPYCEESVRNTIRAAIAGAENRRGVIGVVEGKSGIEGYIMAFITTWWFSDPAHPKGWRLEELTNFVHPEHRNPPGHAKNLIQFAKWMSENIDLILIMGIMTNSRLSAKIRLYEREVTPFGGLFFHNAKDGSLAAVSPTGSA